MIYTYRKDRYNLARIEYIPYLLHNSNAATNRILEISTYVPQFYTTGNKAIGGEVDGTETLKAAEYIVERDINIRPGGRLTLEPGVTLRCLLYLPSVTTNFLILLIEV